jgi:hypothetical protein
MLRFAAACLLVTAATAAAGCGDSAADADPSRAEAEEMLLRFFEREQRSKTDEGTLRDIACAEAGARKFECVANAYETPTSDPIGVAYDMQYTKDGTRAVIKLSTGGS